jgi:hypothetical protein
MATERILAAFDVPVVQSRRVAGREMRLPIREYHSRDRDAPYPIHQRSVDSASPILRSIHRALGWPRVCRPQAENRIGRFGQHNSSLVGPLKFVPQQHQVQAPKPKSC